MFKYIIPAIHYDKKAKEFENIDADTALTVFFFGYMTDRCKNVSATYFCMNL